MCGASAWTACLLLLRYFPSPPLHNIHSVLYMVRAGTSQTPTPQNPGGWRASFTDASPAPWPSLPTHPNTQVEGVPHLAGIRGAVYIKLIPKMQVGAAALGAACHVWLCLCAVALAPSTSVWWMCVERLLHDTSNIMQATTEANKQKRGEAWAQTGHLIFPLVSSHPQPANSFNQQSNTGSLPYPETAPIVRHPPFTTSPCVI